MKVVVTGGLGFIGGHIARRLLNQGHEVIILDTHTAIARSGKMECATQAGDITDIDSLKAISGKNVDAVLHLAGQPSGAKSFEIPEVDIQVNVLGTLNIIKWCQMNDISRLLFASSFTVYGDNPDTEIMREIDSPAPKSLYALSKYTCEQLLKIYAGSNKIHWNALRMFNVYGPGQDITRTDQGIVGIFLSMVKKGNYVGVKGALDRFRDLVYIDDVVQGWELCLKDKTHPGEVYNLASGKKTYIGELIETLIQAFGKTGQVKVEQIGSTPGDIRGCYADIGKISKHLGYQPQYNLKRGIQAMVEWAKSLPG